MMLASSAIAPSRAGHHGSVPEDRTPSAKPDDPDRRVTPDMLDTAPVVSASPEFEAVFRDAFEPMVRVRAPDRHAAFASGAAGAPPGSATVPARWRSGR